MASESMLWTCDLVTLGNKPGTRGEATMFFIEETELRIKAAQDEIEDPNRYDPIRSEERLRAITEKLQRQERLAIIFRNTAQVIKSWVGHFKKMPIARVQ